MADKDFTHRKLEGHPQPKSIAAHEAFKELPGHPQPKELEAHHEKAAAIAAGAAASAATAMSAPPADPVVTADVDNTPRFIKWGALGVLALMFVAIAGFFFFGNHGRMSITEPVLSGMSTARQDASKPTVASVGTPTPSAYLASQPSADGSAAGGAALAGGADADGIAQMKLVAIADPVNKVIYLFEFDSSTIPENADLNALAATAQNTGKNVTVKAYTDERGRAAYNQRLSERRAKAVGDYLVAHGVPVERIVTKGMGPTHAFANNAQDRRAEVTLN